MKTGLNPHECIDVGFKQTAKNGYYAAFKVGAKIPNCYLSAINHYINEELHQVIVVKPSGDVDGYFLQCTIHKLVYGSNGKYIVDKLEELCEEQDLYHLITDWSNVEELYETTTSNNSNS